MPTAAEQRTSLLAQIDAGTITPANCASFGLTVGGFYKLCAQLKTDGGASVTFASQAEAEAGTNTTKAMSPLRTAQAIAALGGDWSSGSFSTVGLALATAASEAAARTALGIDLASIAITGGTISGLTQFGVSMANNTAMTGFALGTITDTTSRPFLITQTLNNASFAGSVVDVAAVATSAATNAAIMRWLGGSLGTTVRMALRSDGQLSFGSFGGSNVMTLRAATAGPQLYFSRADGTGGGSTGTGAGGCYQESGFGLNGFTVASDFGYGWAANTAGSNFVTNSVNDTFLRRRAAGSIILGLTQATTPVAQFISAHDTTTGVGASLTLSGGRGSSAGGALNLATSATNGAPVTHLSISAAGVIDFASASLTTETVVSNKTLTVNVGGASVKILVAA